MAIPSITLQVLDPGLGLTSPAVQTPLLAGTASDGPTDEIVPLTSIAQAVSTFAEGPLPELAGRVISEAGGPVLAGRIATTTAGAMGAVTKTPIDASTGTITVAGDANDAYELEVDITTTGTVGTGAFTYSLDGGRTVSAPITIPAGGTYVIPRSGLTLTFVPGAGAVFFEAGDSHAATSTAPDYDSTALGAFVTVVTASTRPWRFLSLGGRATDESAGAARSAAVATHMGTLAAAHRYRFAMLDSGGDGTDGAATITAFAAVANTRLSVGFGLSRRTTLKPFTGWGQPLQASHQDITARIAAGLISTHAGRVASGPLPGVLSITHDERVSPGMRDAGFATLRTWDQMAGFFPTDGRLKAPVGSDFQRAELRMVMDVACETTVEALTKQANKSVRVLADGTGRIHPADAAAWREVALRPLRVRLSQPLNAEGVRGHVSGVDVTIDTENDVLTTGVVLVNVALVPLGYVEQIAISVGYTNQL